jgi:hypothetical protein
MKKFIKKIAPKLVEEVCGRLTLYKLKREIIRYMKANELTKEKRNILKYLQHNSISIFPYPFTKKYNPKKVRVYTDQSKEMRYVLQDNKRLYFKRGWDEKRIQEYYNWLLIEQDAESPHRYETPDFHVSENDIVIDVGTAEGNFALAVIDRIEKIYLFEVDKDWMEALQATFAPWKDKVVIINKYVSDTDDDHCATLDNLFENEKIDFIKIDIEGAENKLLAGAKKILSKETALKIDICTYHRQNDAEVLQNILTENGFHTELSTGYMIFLDDKLTPPYLRKVLIRAEKNRKN